MSHLFHDNIAVDWHFADESAEDSVRLDYCVPFALPIRNGDNLMW